MDDKFESEWIETISKILDITVAIPGIMYFFLTSCQSILIKEKMKLER